jgi:phosphopantothenoylcysteine decarboxylase/phosphopantothenate--cysteine ligase
MNTRMYRNPALQRNMETLRSMGARFIEPGTGSLACGTEGQGRLAEPDRIVEELAALFLPRELAGRRVLVTAGPTHEAIDAVRFISNPSTGKMGYALAAAAQERGAEVILISGPVQLALPGKVKVVPVMSASDMRAAVLEYFPKSHIVIMAAAVSDFRPVTTEKRKIKKEEAPDTIKLERTDDILAELGKAGGPQLLVGFAAETDELERNALAKLKAKNLDMIVANDVLQKGSGFGADTNAVVCYDRFGARQDFPLMPKSELAGALINSIIALMKRKSSL